MKLVKTDGVSGYVTVKRAAKLLKLSEAAIQKRVRTRPGVALTVGATILVRLRDITDDPRD